MYRLKKYLLLISIIIIVLIFIIVLFFVNTEDNINKQLNNNTELNNSELDNNIESTASETKFNEKETKIIDAIYNKFNVYSYFDNSNLKSFEIISLENYGYYESESNVIYVKVHYEIACNDETYDCDNLGRYKDINGSPENPYFFIKIDMNTYDSIEKINGISAHINSDWVSKAERIE